MPLHVCDKVKTPDLVLKGLIKVSRRYCKSSASFTSFPACSLLHVTVRVKFLGNQTLIRMPVQAVPCLEGAQLDLVTCTHISIGYNRRCLHNIGGFQQEHVACSSLSNQLTCGCLISLNIYPPVPLSLLLGNQSIEMNREDNLSHPGQKVPLKPRLLHRWAAELWNNLQTFILIYI